MIRVLYLAHDLSDAGIWRRVQMLELGGASVQVAGFRRAAIGADRPDTIDLGMTENARLGQRARAVAVARLRLRGLLAGHPVPDVIVARNLEMLALAPVAQRAFGAARPPIVYECLDVHRIMLRPDLVGRAMRFAETRLARKAALLWTSSPGFLRNYFDRFGTVSAPVRLVENKFLETGADQMDIAPHRLRDGVLRIGWFGILRCARSLAFLDALSKAARGKIEVVLRGRPALDAIPDFDATVTANPSLRFAGPYAYPDDLPGIYGAVDFAWLIDWYDAGQNSEWLLPNRLYEGSRFGAVPIARTGTEIARFLAQRGLGYVTDATDPAALAAALTKLSSDDHDDLRRAVAAAGRETWSADATACRHLVADLATLRSMPRQSLVVEGARG